MAWYAYCVAERQAFPELIRHRRPMPLEGVHGVFGNQTFLFPAGEFAVVVSEHDAAQAFDQRAPRDHAMVVGHCFKLSTILPFRFGTTFADDDGLRRSLRSNQRQFLANMDRLRGKAEMHLKVTVEDTSRDHDLPMPTTTGKEYLHCLHENAARLRERQTKARAVYTQMHRMFSPLDADISCKRLDQGRLMLDIAHLIEHRYQNKYTSAAQTMKECVVQMSGPWPPYHFVQKNVRAVA
jgi:hypothetical protein